MQTRKLLWDADAWEDYLYWQNQDKKTLRRINQLLKDIQRSPYTGIGKPEALKENLSGLWSRRVDEENRLVYAAEGDTILIFSCRGHYES